MTIDCGVFQRRKQARIDHLAEELQYALFKRPEFQTMSPDDRITFLSECIAEHLGKMDQEIV